MGLMQYTYNKLNSIKKFVVQLILLQYVLNAHSVMVTKLCDALGKIFSVRPYKRPYSFKRIINKKRSFVNYNNKCITLSQLGRVIVPETSTTGEVP